MDARSISELIPPYQIGITVKRDDNLFSQNQGYRMALDFAVECIRGDYVLLPGGSLIQVISYKRPVPDRRFSAVLDIGECFEELARFSIEGRAISVFSQFMSPKRVSTFLYFRNFPHLEIIELNSNGNISLPRVREEYKKSKGILSFLF